MKSRGTGAPARRQSGVYIMAIGVLLGIAITLLLFVFVGDIVRSNVRDERTAVALEQAKQALIGYAATYRDTHPGEVFGYLPCPDIDGDALGDGIAESSCGAKDVTVVGRLPYRTLDLPPLRDGSGECLWYAVSGNFKNNPKTDLMNWDTNGLIEVMRPDGATFIAGAGPTTRAAAVVFAPGPILPGQDRSLGGANPPRVCGGNYSAANYLDTDVNTAINNATAAAAANALTRFAAALPSDRTAAPGDSFNDRLVVIQPDDIFAKRINLRADLDPLLTDPATGMLRLMVDCIVRYGRGNAAGVNDKRLPWAAPMTLANYGNPVGYDDAAGTYSGRFPYRADTSAATTNNTRVLGAGGVLLTDSGSQPCASWAPVDEFWNNWKDQTFYAVAKAFAPNSAVASNADPCASDECLTVAGNGNIAAVVIFSGRRQGGQNRNNDANPAYTSADKANPVNTLEGANVAAIQSNTPGVAPWPRQFVKAGTNDIVMCVAYDTTSGLYAEPTCASTSACQTQGSMLAGYRSGNINNCKVGKDSLLPACKALEDWIHQNNCPCHKAAHQFTDKECLKGFTTTKCIDAHASLAAC